MPSSKRNRTVHTSRVKKKTKEWKEGIINQTRELVDKYPNLYVFRYESFKTAPFRQLREDYKETCRFMLGSNKLVQVALGNSPELECADDIHKISELLVGNTGVLFTSLDQRKVQHLVDNFVHDDYAKAGSSATEDVSFPEGELKFTNGDAVPHTMLEQLKNAGMPVKLNKGIIYLLQDFQVCTQDEELGPSQAQILRLFKIKQAKFQLRLVAMWSAGNVDFF